MGDADIYSPSVNVMPGSTQIHVRHESIEFISDAVVTNIWNHIRLEQAYNQNGNLIFR